MAATKNSPERASFQSGECRPVGADELARAANPGLRCAAPWAMEFGPFGAGGLRPLRSPERASFHSPGCNPGYPGKRTIVALKGRHSRGAPIDNQFRRAPRADKWRRNAGICLRVSEMATRCGCRECRPVGADELARAANPGLRCAAPWAMEFGPFGAGRLRRLLSPERASFHSPGCNPGYPGKRTIVALKGRHSRGAPIDNQFRRAPRTDERIIPQTMNHRTAQRH
jgi:hypothetical protein